MSWPEQSADLNPIQLLCDDLDRKFKCGSLQATLAGKLKKTIFILLPVERMTRICGTVIADKRLRSVLCFFVFVLICI